MKLIEKILFATNFDKDVENVMQEAILLAKSHSSEIIMMHVIPEVQNSPLALDMIKEAVTNRLLIYQKKIRKNGINSDLILVDTGSPFDKIIARADHLNVNVIMIGSRGMPDGKKYQLGLTAERLIRKSTKPVWVVKYGTKPKIKKILCPVDFSDPSKRSLENAIHLGRMFKAKLTVLTVVPPIKTLYTYMLKYETRMEMQKDFNETWHIKFENFLKDFNFHNMQWDKIVREGAPHREILDSMLRISPDHLIMGSTGRTGLPRIFLGSTAAKVIREIPCSLITVKSEHVVRLKLETEIADLETHYKQGKELLDQGLPKDALVQFEYCLKHDIMFAPAWEGMAAAHEQLGDKKESEKALKEAKMIREQLWYKQVEAEIRGQHFLFKKK
ncbi:MAG: universal stress protein [Calditrichia bacterium]